MIDSMLMMLAAAVAGGFGAALRFVIDGAVMARMAGRVAGSPFPLGIWLVNLSGSFAIGVLTGFVSVGTPALAVLGVGLLGGYTTFSTASVDTVRLMRRGRLMAALLNGFGQMFAATGLAGLGYVLAQLLTN